MAGRAHGRGLTDEDIAAIYTQRPDACPATAEAIAQRTTNHQARTVRPVPNLRERGFGIFEGQTYAQIATDWPEGRSAGADVTPTTPHLAAKPYCRCARVAHTLQSLAHAHTGEQIVLVATAASWTPCTAWPPARTCKPHAPGSWAMPPSTACSDTRQPDGGWAGRTRHLDAASLDEQST